MSAADRLLDRLQRVKQTRPGVYVAACPCCQSRRGRPIAVRVPDSGNVLLHAFCGCETGEVLGALGLSLADLFDAPLQQHLPPVRGGFTSRELLELVAHEVMVAAILATDAETAPLTAEDTTRLRQAAARIGKAAELTHG